MSPLAPPYRPTNELVAAAWLALYVPEFTAAMVGSSLPKDTNKWAVSGFVQVSALASGSPLVDLPVRKPIVQVDAWGTANTSDTASSIKPPWNLAAQLIEAIRFATEGAQTGRYGKSIAVKANYLNARVQAVYLVTEPLRVPDDPSGYARFTVDLAVDWVPA